MKNVTGKINLNKLEIKPHNIVFTYTSGRDYEMSRYILLEGLENIFPEMKYNDYLLLEGGHCSCYDFDETTWDGTIYSYEELIKLADAEYRENDPFWEMIKKY